MPKWLLLHPSVRMTDGSFERIDNLIPLWVCCTAAPAPLDAPAPLVPGYIPGTVQSPVQSPKLNAKFASNRYSHSANSIDRFDSPHLHVADLDNKRKSKGRCQYCGQANSCSWNCIICRKPLHFANNTYGWPCAQHYHDRRKKDYCWADLRQCGAVDTDWQCKDPKVQAVKKKVQEVTSPDASGLRRRKVFTFTEEGAEKTAPAKKPRR